MRLITLGIVLLSCALLSSAAEPVCHATRAMRAVRKYCSNGETNGLSTTTTNILAPMSRASEISQSMIASRLSLSC
jgi:hypothetical protein